MTKTLSVAAIQHGTVIDHINSGQALHIIRLLDLQKKNHKVTIGLNLPSKRLQYKDIIKIENHVLSNDEANEVTVLAPLVSINIIDNFEVVKKINTTLPSHIVNVFACPNPACITQSEPVETYFKIETHGNRVNFFCRYCEKSFDRNQVSENIK